MLPDSARLLDVLAMEPPAAMGIAGRWRAGGRSTLAVIGESYDGPFGIDLRKDGPHALIAGHHRVGEVGAAADDRRLARGRQPAR